MTSDELIDELERYGDHPVNIRINGQLTSIKDVTIEYFDYGQGNGAEYPEIIIEVKKATGVSDA